MTGSQRTALVVLAPGVDPSVPAERAGEVPPGPDVVDRVVTWFRDRGFETGPVVGISFAVTGDEEQFAASLGTGPPVHGTGGDLVLPMEGMDSEVRRLVDAVVLPAPPDFGPGNP